MLEYQRKHHSKNKSTYVCKKGNAALRPKQRESAAYKLEQKPDSEHEFCRHHAMVKPADYMNFYIREHYHISPKYAAYCPACPNCRNAWADIQKEMQ